LEKECALYDNDEDVLIDFQNEAEERAREACLRAEELERDLVIHQMESKKSQQENAQATKRAKPMV
jgi:hypothetical protein